MITRSVLRNIRRIARIDGRRWTPASDPCGDVPLRIGAVRELDGVIVVRIAMPTPYECGVNCCGIDDYGLRVVPQHLLDGWSMTTAEHERWDAACGLAMLCRPALDRAAELVAAAPGDESGNLASVRQQLLDAGHGEDVSAYCAGEILHYAHVRADAVRWGLV